MCWYFIYFKDVPEEEEEEEIITVGLSYGTTTGRALFISQPCEMNMVSLTLQMRLKKASYMAQKRWHWDSAQVCPTLQPELLSL